MNKKIYKADSWYLLPPQVWAHDPNNGYGRDSQRSRVYAAENAAMQEMAARNWGLSEARRRIAGWTHAGWWGQAFGWSLKRSGVNVQMSLRRNPWSSQHNNSIHLCLATSPMVVLHELIHLARPQDAGPAHGRWFARALLYAAYNAFSAHAHGLLIEAYDFQGVHYTPKWELVFQLIRRREAAHR